MMRTQWMAVGLAITLVGAPGCATVMSGHQGRLQVEVEAPEGAVTTTVKNVDRHDSVTRTERRFEVTVDRGSDYVVVASGDGLGHRIKVVKSEFNHWIWGNYGFIFAGIALSAASPTRTIDGATGQVLSSTPNYAYMGWGYTLILAGLVVDLLTGSYRKHDKTQIDLLLEPQAAPGPGSP